MKTYPKINTIWERDEKGFIREGKICKPEFDQVQYYLIQEKIDGTNIRVYWNEDEMEPKFMGKTDAAEIPKPLLEHLKTLFTREKLESVFRNRAHEATIFGEGYGGKIQSVGKYYSVTEKFILFDCWIDGWWLEEPALLEIATKLGIRIVPNFGIMKVEEAIEVVKAKPDSSMTSIKIPIEGIVAKSCPMVLFRDGTPIFWKLKCRDFDKLNRKKEG